MPTLKEILDIAQDIAPQELAEDWDNSGLLVNAKKDVKSALVVLDITNKVIDEAASLGCELIVAHHPVIFSPLKKIDGDDVVYSLVKQGMSALCMHTNWDAAEGGVNDVLCELLAMQNTQKLGFGRMGKLEKPMQGIDFARLCAKALGTPVQLADSGKHIATVAVVGGSGKDLLGEAYQNGADCLLTGEAGHHVALEALALGVSLVQAGHYATEKPAMAELAKKLQSACPGLLVHKSKVEADPLNWIAQV